MHMLMLDTCVWLELASKKAEQQTLAAIEYLVSTDTIKLLIPELVEEEFHRNKDRVANQTRQRLSQECKLVKEIIEAFGGENKDAAIEVINDVNHRLPILSEANQMTINRVESLFNTGVRIKISDKSKLKASERAISKSAPFHKGKNSMADAVLIEAFHEFREENEDTFESFRFVTLNSSDFSGSDHRKPHEDFALIFNTPKSNFFISPITALSDLADKDEIEFETGYGEQDETRGLFEIIEAMDELFDKIWYNRHCNRMYRIEQGEIKIIPSNTQKYGNDVIHEDVLRSAINAANILEEKYKDLGPWSDFEWGMLNGKLSALRWVLGEEWDMLDT